MKPCTIKTAETAGFCPGVHTAVRKLNDEILKGNDPLYTWGPIIHNKHVVEEFKRKGVIVLNTLEEISHVPKGTIVIRSHGTTRSVIERMQKEGFQVIDGTCSFVKRIHRIVEEQSNQGRHVVIIGNPEHPEVIGIMGWCSGPCMVIGSASDAQQLELPVETPLSIVCQTTFRSDKFEEFVEIIAQKGYNIYVSGTVCNATSMRQKEAAELAGQVEVMLVAGDRNSSNTQKLYEICKAECENTYLVEMSSDISPTWLTGHESIGITAGASTPNNIIKEVQNSVRSYF